MTLPATLMTNRSPRLDMNICSGITRESEHVTTMAKGL